MAVAKDQARHQYVGDKVNVKAIVKLNNLAPEDVNVELYYGQLNPEEEIAQGESRIMNCRGETPEGHYIFEGIVPCNHTGHHGFTIRVLPYNRGLLNKFDTGLLTWLKEPLQQIDFNHPILSSQTQHIP